MMGLISVAISNNYNAKVMVPLILLFSAGNITAMRYFYITGNVKGYRECLSDVKYFIQQNIKDEVPNS
jgi:hypothetical protein